MTSAQAISEYNPANIPHARELFGLLDQLEGDALYRYAKASHGSIIEIGTYCGYSTLFLGFGIRNREEQYQHNVQIFTVDTHRYLSHRHLDSEEMCDQHRRGQPCSFRQMVKNCKQYNVWDLVSPIVDDASHAWKFGINAACGMLFIDGNHTLALRDYQNWAPFIEIGGIVCFHDYSEKFPQVIADVDQLVAMGDIEKLELVKCLFIGRILRHSPRL